MDMITVSAKTVDEAVTKALIELKTRKQRFSGAGRKAGCDPRKEEGNSGGQGH